MQRNKALELKVWNFFIAHQLRNARSYIYSVFPPSKTNIKLQNKKPDLIESMFMEILFFPMLRCNIPTKG